MVLSPLRGFFYFSLIPTADAVGYSLTPLRGWRLDRDGKSKHAASGHAAHAKSQTSQYLRRLVKNQDPSDSRPFGTRSLLSPFPALQRRAILIMSLRDAIPRTSVR